jgi:DNA-binding MarR family transcriptional regulator
MSFRRSQKTKRVSDSDYRALAEFRYHIRRYLEFSDRAAKASGIEPKQYQLLLAIRSLSKDRDAVVGTLAEQLRVKHHSAVELINRAETKGLVRRSRVGTRVFVRLTKRGERILAKAVEERLPELRAAAPVLVKALQHLTGRNRSSLP